MKPLVLKQVECSGLNLIEASAGTGKTWTIAALYILLMLERELKAGDLLVVTYTRAAAAELRERIRQRISGCLSLCSGREPADELEQLLVERGMTTLREQAILTRALYGFDDAAIYTIHGFCQRALTENAFESGSLFNSEMITDQSELIRQASEDFWRREVMPGRGALARWLLKSGQTPEKLLSALKGHFQERPLRVIPDGTAEDPDAAVAVRESLFHELGLVWQERRQLVLNALVEAGLSQISFKESQIVSRAAELDDFFRGDGADIPQALTFFTTKKISDGRKKGSVMPSDPFFLLCDRFLQSDSACQESLERGLADLRKRLSGWVGNELSRRKSSLNVRCYEDLLLDLNTALTGEGGDRLAHSLRSRYPAALIDEFQDTDPLQWQIFRKISEQPGYPLFLVGDPKQAIYSFRGADIQSYLTAARCAGQDRRLTISTNRRSSLALVTAVNSLFASSNDPFLSEEISFEPVQSGRDAGHRLLRHKQEVQAPLRFRLLASEPAGKPISKTVATEAATSDAVAQISRMLDGSWELARSDGARHLGAGDIAVLVMTHIQANQVQAALTDAGIPSVQHGGSTIYASREAHWILTLLKVVARPSRTSLVVEALLSPLFDITADRLYGMIDSGTGEWDVWLERFRSLHDDACSGGVMSLSGRLLGEFGVRSTALKCSGGERRLTNLEHCFELLHRVELEGHLGLEGLASWLERKITSEKKEEDEALLRLESDRDAVQIVTIHTSKGLQYPVVLLPFCWYEPDTKPGSVLFHDEDGMLTLDLGSSDIEEHRQIAGQERSGELTRLLYVAVTRAEFFCSVTWGSINNADKTPLHRLLHDGEGKLTEQKLRDDINRIAAAGGQVNGSLTIAVEQADDEPVAMVPQHLPTSSLQVRQLGRPVNTGWRVSSFSGMMAGGEHHFQQRDYDPLTDKDLLQQHQARARDIFAFPRGTQAGSCLHAIFEKLDFSACGAAETATLAAGCLASSGYGPEWLPAVRSMVECVTAVTLDPADSGSRLDRLAHGEWVCEQEFFLPVASLSRSRLEQVFDGLLDPARHGDFSNVLSELRIQESHGMLQGAIDMVCRHNGRYYIIDWKSNYLGDRPEEYRGEALVDSMAHHGYVLQYHLYAAALHRHLAQRLAGYCYEEHFGGILYIFLRGVTADDPQSGVYRSRPPLTFITRMEELVLAPASGGNS